MLAGLVARCADPKALAELARGRLREQLPRPEQAIQGQFAHHQRFPVTQQLAHIDVLDEAIAHVSAEIAERLRPAGPEAIARLDTMPGVGRRIAEIIVAEVGAELGHFLTAWHLASWAGMGPGNNASAGKRFSGKARKGIKWLRTALVEAGQAAGRAKATSLGARCRCLLVRRGKEKAAVAVGHSMPVIAYQPITRQQTYADLGPQYFEKHRRPAIERRLVRRLQAPGNKVTLEPIAAYSTSGPRFSEQTVRRASSEMSSCKTPHLRSTAASRHKDS